MRSLRWILAAAVVTVGVLLMLQRRAEHGEVAQAAPSVGPAENAPFELTSTRASDDTPDPAIRESDESVGENASAREAVPTRAGSMRGLESVRARIELKGRVFGRGHDLTEARARVVQQFDFGMERSWSIEVDAWGVFTWTSNLLLRTARLSVSVEHPTLRCRAVIVPIEVPDERWMSDEPIRLEVELESVLPCTLHGVARTMAPAGQVSKVYVHEVRDGQPISPAVTTLEFRREREVEFDFEVPLNATYALTATSQGARPTTKIVEVGGLLSMDVGVLEIDAGAEFSGHLIVDGRPLAGADVVAHLGGFNLFKQGLGADGLTWWNGEFEWRQIHATTDATGRFSFAGATLGNYEVSVAHRSKTVFVSRASASVATPADDVLVGTMLRRIEVELSGRNAVTTDEALTVIDRTTDQMWTSWDASIDATGRTTFYAEPGSRVCLSYKDIERHSFTVRDHERIKLDVSSTD